jgi:hypothetical protein
MFIGLTYNDARNCSVFVNINHIVYFDSGKIVLKNGDILKVQETAAQIGGKIWELTNHSSLI